MSFKSVRDLERKTCIVKIVVAEDSLAVRHAFNGILHFVIQCTLDIMLVIIGVDI